MSLMAIVKWMYFIVFKQPTVVCNNGVTDGAVSVCH